MVQHTNNYVRYCILKKRQLRPNYVDKLWALDGSNNVTVPELKAYFGILIILGINPVKQYQMAFSSDPFLGNEGIQRTMTLKRFEKIAQYFHISDRANEPGRNGESYDPLYKVKPLLTAMNKQFLALCGSGSNCAIDESMIKCKSRLPYIIYQPQKPVRCDIQVFVRSNSPMGYMQQFQIYVGSKMIKTSSNGLYFDVVNSLTKPLHGTYARVYFDNAYTSIPILHHLQKNKNLACGTIRALRKYLPPETKKPEKMIRDQHKTFQDVDVFMTTTVWQDTKPVRFASNFHKPHVTSTTMRRVGRQYVQVSIPHISKEYQKHYKTIDFFVHFQLDSKCCCC